jgi:fatty-acyl-CoA synthase
VFRGGWLHTGDLATRDAAGFVTLVGRERDMYISGGENVYPAQVEAVYTGHPGVADVAVAGVADPEWGETGHCWIIPRDGTALVREELLAFGRERLASYKLPRHFHFVSEFPRTETGKVRKHLLRRDPAG